MKITLPQQTVTLPNGERLTVMQQTVELPDEVAAKVQRLDEHPKRPTPRRIRSKEFPHSGEGFTSEDYEKAVEHIREALRKGVTVSIVQELSDDDVAAVLEAIYNSYDPHFWGCSYGWHLSEFDPLPNDPETCSYCSRPRSEHRTVPVCPAEPDKED